MALSLSALQQVLARSGADAWLFYLTVSHPSIGTPLRFVNGSHVAVTSNGLVYQPTRFDIAIGSQEIDGQSQVKLSISVVDQTLLQTLRGFDPGPTVDVFCTLGASPNTVQFTQAGMTMQGFDLSGLAAIEATLTGTDKLLEPYPGQLMDRINAPGIFTDA